MAQQAHRDAIRFLIAGGLNTLLTFAVYQLLLFVAPHQVAYAGSWLCGLTFVVVAYPNKVFVGGERDLSSRLWLGASYIMIFLLGFGILELLVDLGISPRFAIVAVLMLTTAVNFCAGRLLLRKN